MKSFFRNILPALLIAFVLFSAALAQTSRTAEAFPSVKIKNFGQMDVNYYRGGQPKVEDYQSLKALGVTTVIDLRNDSEAYEKPTVEGLGMKYINIPMDDKEYPSDATIGKFLKEINDPANGVMYVHCKGGKHRAGVTGAVYRYTKYGWNYDQVMAEMEKFNFDTSWGREVMKKFVVEYAAKAKHTDNTAAGAAASKLD